MRKTGGKQARLRRIITTSSSQTTEEEKRGKYRSKAREMVYQVVIKSSTKVRGVPGKG